MALKKSVLICVAACALLSPVMAEAATDPTLYGLAKRSGGADELFSYDLSQDPSLGGYSSNSLATLNENPFLPNSITAIAVSGSTLYALAKRSGGADELFSYDLSQDPSLGGYSSNSLATLNENPFLPDSITSIAVSGSTLYALSKRSGGADELFSYDLNQDISLGGYHSSSLATLNENPFLADTITSIAVSGSTLYALSKRPGGADELFSYDLSQDISLGGYHSNSLAPLNENPFLPNSITSLAISLPASQSAAVPELSTWAYMLVGFGLLGLSARRTSNPWRILPFAGLRRETSEK